LLTLPSSLVSVFPSPPEPAAMQDLNTYFNRASFYAYHEWQILDPLQLEGGVTYDWMKFPANSQTAPISNEEETTSQLSPKAGLIWDIRGFSWVTNSPPRGLINPLMEG
jgi:outer membrane receptor protein involved in Fe transport